MAYVTLNDIRQHGGYSADETSRDAEISALIPRAQSAIERHTNNVFEVDSTSERTFDYVSGRELLFDEWMAVTTDLVITNGDGDVVASSNYVTMPLNNAPFYGVKLKTGSDVVWEYEDSPEGAISVVGYWGYSQTPPEDVKMACIQLILHWLRLEDQAEAAMMPDDIQMLLKPYKKLV
jgi:hypothetical protein